MSCVQPRVPPEPVTITRGESKTFLLTIRDVKNELRDLTGAKVWFTVKNRVEDVSPVIAKKNVAAGGIDNQILISTPQTGATIGQAQIYLDPADTAGLDPDASYWCDAWAQVPAYKGTSTAVGAGSLTDSAQTLVVNKLTGGVLQDSAGTSFTIISNTVTIITVSGNPAAGAYAVFISKRYQVLSNRQFIIEPSVTTNF